MWPFKKKITNKPKVEPLEIGGVYFFYKCGVDKPHPFHDVDDKYCSKIIDVKEGFVRSTSCYASGKLFTVGGDDVHTEAAFRKLYNRKISV